MEFGKDMIWDDWYDWDGIHGCGHGGCTIRDGLGWPGVWLWARACMALEYLHFFLVAMRLGPVCHLQSTRDGDHLMASTGGQ